MRWDRSLRVLAAAMVLGFCWTSPVSAAPHRSSLEVDVGFFYNDLSPYGRWYEVDDYGWVWSPRVSAGWRPYTTGRWVMTDEYGWMWASDEPYAWAVYHYGRWDWDPALGWVWVPGYDWAPAWVAFRSGGGYVGWAPLSPRVRWEVGVGFRVGAVQLDTYIAPHHYCFVDERVFLDRDVGRRAVPLSRNVTIINVTQNITNYGAVGERVVNRSLSVDRVERVTRRAVPRVRTVEVASVRDARHAKVKGDRVEVFRPDVVRYQADRTPPQGKRLGRALARSESREPLATTREQDRYPREADRRGVETPRLREREREAEQQRQLEERREVERRQKAEHEQKLAAQREAERQHQAEHERQLQRQRQAEQQRRAEQQRLAERQRELDRQREADRREQEKRIAREREERERQRQDVEKRQSRERESLEARHRQEIKRPSRDAADDLDHRQAQEHRAIEERQQRERQQVEAQREQARRERDAQSERRAADNRSNEKKKKEKERSREKPPSDR